MGIELYKISRKFVRTGDAILWMSNTVLGWMIRQWSPGFNHASLALNLKEYSELQDRRWMLESLENGVVLTLISLRINNFKGQVWCYPIKPEFDQYRPHVASWALNKVGTPYDYGGLLKNIIGKVSADAKKFFCSEFFYMAWAEIMQDDFGMKKAPRPSDIPLMGLFDKPFRIY